MFSAALSWLGPGFLSFAVAFVVAIVLTPIMIRIAAHRQWFDRPGHRKIHTSPIPRLGGVALFLAHWAGWGVFAYFFGERIPYESVRPFYALFAASTLVWVLGIYDDFKATNARHKVFVQLIAAIIVVGGGLGIRIVRNPISGHDVFTPEWLTWVLTVGWLVVVTNSVNLIDGLDGLASGVCFIMAMTLYFVSKDLGSPHLPYFALSLAGSCLGFLIFNFSPARIFLGDSGSLFLGFILASLSIIGTTKRSAAIVLYGPPVILGLPVLDTLFAVFRRFLRRVHSGEMKGQSSGEMLQRLWFRFREVFRADQEHIHHGLVKIGLSHRRAVIVLYLITALLGVTAYRTAVYDHLLGTGIVILVLSAGLFWLRREVRKEP